MFDHLQALEEDAFLPIGRTAVYYLDGHVAKQYIDENEARPWEWTVYAHVIDDHVVRIGKCESSLEKAAQEWERLLTRAMNGIFQIGGSNPWEAYHWRRRLTEGGKGRVFARIVVQTKVKSADEKRAAQEILRRERGQLIKKYDPLLCHDTRTARDRPRVATGVRNLAHAREYHRYLLGLEAGGHPVGNDAEFKWSNASA
jgi:hypothetical protein